MRETHIYPNCLVCGQKFKTIPAEIRKGGGKYCSQACFHKRPITEEYRKNLGIGVRKSLPYRVLPDRKGANHPRWIKDRTQVKDYWTEKNNPEYKQWRIKVYERDDFECRIADTNCKGRIEAHHILPWRNHPELRYEINNGITLCHFHHPRREAEEKQLAPIFRELLALAK